MGLLTVLGISLAAAVVASLMGARAPGVVRAPRAARPGLAGLPLAARGPVAAALGSENRAYWIHRGSATNPTQDLRLRFSDSGVSVSSDRGLVDLSLAEFGRGTALRPVAGAAPVVHANRVLYSRGALREWYENGPLGLEQGFDVARAPSAGRGRLVFAMSLWGSLRAHHRGDAVILSGDGTTLRYTAPVASDARGRALPASLRVSGSRLEISVDDQGARYPLRVDPFVAQGRLTASDGAAGDDLGFSVAVSGNTIVAGAPFHQVGANPARGSAYVFVEPAGGWANATQTAELTASDGGARDQLGSSVAISGNRIVVGAPYHQVGPIGNQGAAYVFVEPAGGWANAKQTAELTASDGAANDGVGSSVAVSGNAVVAGAPYHQVGANPDQGAAYVFVEPASGWANATQTAELAATDGGVYDELGSSVVASGNTVVAGAPYHQVGATIGQGIAYVFVEPAGGWANGTQTAELTASDGRSYDYLGFSVAVAANTVVAGAPYHQVGANSDQGAAYVFVEPAGGWANGTETAELTASDGGASDYLGLSTAISGNTVTAGAPYHQVAGQIWHGAAYVFVEPAGGWANVTQTTELTAPGGAASDYTGLSAAVGGQTIVAGVPGQRVLGNAAQGALAVFGVPQPTSTSVSCAPNPVVVGQPATCTATTVGAGGGRPDGGQVTFLANGRTLRGCGVITLDTSTLKAACRQTYASPGVDTVQAVYSGNPHFAASESPNLTQTVKSSVTLRGSPSGRSGMVSFRLSCAARSSGCHVVADVTTTETLQGKRVLAVSARAKLRRRTVLVGERAVRISAAKTITVTIALNATGRKLLSQFKHLPADLTVSLTVAREISTVASRKLTVRP